MAIGLASALAGRGEDVTLCVTRGSRARRPSGSGRQRLAGARSQAALGASSCRVQADAEADQRAADRGVACAQVRLQRLGDAVRPVAQVPVLVAQEQTWSYEGQPLRKVLDGVIGRVASSFVAVSSADRDRMISRERVPAEKIVVIPNAFVPREEGPPGDLRAELGIAPDAPLVGTACQLRPQKALHVLVDAFARVAETRPGAEAGGSQATGNVGPSLKRRWNESGSPTGLTSSATAKT